MKFCFVRLLQKCGMSCMISVAKGVNHMTENMQKLLEYLSKNQEAKDKVTSATKNEIIAIAAEQGIPLTEKDFEPSEEDKPVNFDELGSAAGGKVCACVAGGGGEANHNRQDVCACVAIGYGHYWTPEG